VILGKPQFVFLIVISGFLSGCVTHTPAPVSGLNKDYGSLSRGSYRGSYYEVKKGDTLYFIAYVTDKDVSELVAYNDLDSSYTIYPGQKLKIWQPAYKPPVLGFQSKNATVAASNVSTVAPTASAVVATSPANASSSSASSSTASMKKERENKVEQSKPKEYVQTVSKKNVNKKVINAKKDNNRISQWLWPTKGRLIKSFSAGDQGNKGIDIAGQRGQSILSTARGTVVYSGNALRGYGNLVIIKHNDNYLSAYAHNDRLLVHEGQSVKAGQKIATMGSSGTSSVRLHFEIRYQGKSVNPKRYLP